VFVVFNLDGKFKQNNRVFTIGICFHKMLIIILFSIIFVICITGKRITRKIVVTWCNLCCSRGQWHDRFANGI